MKCVVYLLYPRKKSRGYYGFAFVLLSRLQIYHNLCGGPNRPTCLLLSYRANNALLAATSSWEKNLNGILHKSHSCPLEVGVPG